MADACSTPGRVEVVATCRRCRGGECISQASCSSTSGVSGCPWLLGYTTGKRKRAECFYKSWSAPCSFLDRILDILPNFRTRPIKMALWKSIAVAAAVAVSVVDAAAIESRGSKLVSSVSTTSIYWIARTQC
jgi:hypothetical protein